MLAKKIKNNPQPFATLKCLMKANETIGIDIDGTLADTISATLTEIHSRFGNVITFDDWKRWNPHEIRQLQACGIRSIQDTLDLFYEILRENGRQIVMPIAGSVEGVGTLRSLGKELIALSGRMEDSRSYTTKWLERNYPGVFQQILLTDHDTLKQVPKYELAKQYKIGLMIEDNAYYAIDLVNHGIPTILLETPWNTVVDTSKYTDIYRVKDWKEVNSLLS